MSPRVCMAHFWAALHLRPQTHSFFTWLSQKWRLNWSWVAPDKTKIKQLNTEPIDEWKRITRSVPEVSRPLASRCSGRTDRNWNAQTELSSPSNQTQLHHHGINRQINSALKPKAKISTFPSDIWSHKFFAHCLLNCSYRSNLEWFICQRA